MDSAAQVRRAKMIAPDGVVRLSVSFGTLSCLEKLAGYLEQALAAHGWVEDQVWTAAKAATLIGRKFHVSYSLSGATRLVPARL